MPPFGRMPIRKDIVDEHRQVFQPSTNFVIGDEEMLEQRFESMVGLKTVLDAAQPAKGAMFSDTPRVSRGTIPKHLKHISRGPVRESSRKRGSGAKSTSGER